MNDIVICLGLVLVLVWGSMIGYSNKAQEAMEAQSEVVAQCEENLPRNQHCEVVISAKVVKDEL